MVNGHDFINFPELTNSQMAIYYFESPHKQILQDFQGTVVSVKDGDTISLRTDFRDFDFPLRILDIDAPEMSEGGQEARDWLTDRILEKQVEIKINKNRRVGKFGRLLGKVISAGIDVGNEELTLGLATKFGAKTGLKTLPDLNKEFVLEKWLSM